MPNEEICDGAYGHLSPGQEAYPGGHRDREVVELSRDPGEA